MRTIVALAVAAAALAPAATAAPKVTVDLYSVPQASIDALVPGRRDADESGTGAGLRAVAPAGRRVVVIGGVHSARYDGGIDYEEMRLGIGTPRVAGSGASAYVEYVGTELAGARADGAGAHLRYATSAAKRLQFHAEGGILSLHDSAERITGWELAGGSTLRVSRWLGLFVDYRAMRLRGRSSELELEFADVRVGGRVTFGDRGRGP